MNNALRLSGALFLLLVCAVVITGVHLWVTDRLEVLRFFYTAQAVVTRGSIRCSDEAPAWIRGAVARAIDYNHSLSNQLAYINTNGHLHHCESGWLNGMLISPRLNETDRFRYASTTKLFTADAILNMVAAQRLSLDDQLVDLLPEIDPVADERTNLITVEHLLRHQAGFDRLRSGEPMFTHRKRPPCPYDIAQLGHAPLDFAPGERSAYSNLGYCLLGMIVERVSGEPYRSYMNREYALDAAGIRFVDGDYFADEVTYDFRNSDHYGASYSKYFDLPAVSSSAGLSGSAAALAQAVRPMVLRQNFGLASATMPPGCDPSVLRSCYGYAFFTLQSAEGKLRLHIQPGLLYGVSTLVIADSEGGVVVWLGNGMPTAEDVVANDMIRYLQDALSDHYEQQSLVDARDAL